jgi:uncharacterized protein|nr:DUF177 domain-containing protein [Kofleriaceae bacterium]
MTGPKPAKDAPFVVLVRELPLHKRFEVGGLLASQWLRGLPMRDALGAPDEDPQAGGGVAELDLYAEGSHGFAAGTFKGFVTVACSRCIEPVRLDIDDKVRITFMPAAEMPADDDEPATGEDGKQLADEDLDLFPFDGERIDLEPFLREELVLAIPYAPLCKEDCKGLCPQCGADWNTETCACEKPVDPRLAALKGLKL